MKNFLSRAAGTETMPGETKFFRVLFLHLASAHRPAIRHPKRKTSSVKITWEIL
jgi:hypothetical protein